MKVVLFWSTFRKGADVSLGSWRQRPLDISVFHYLPLLSHAKWGHDVDLYTYQDLDTSAGIPDGINLIDADSVFPARYAFNALERGHSIAHISDAVRLHSIADARGIALDMDAVMLRPFDSSAEASDVGWFASMPAKATGGFAPQWGKAHPPLTIHDNGQQQWDGKALSCFPIKANSVTEKKIRRLAGKIMGKLASSVGKSSAAWNYVLWDIKNMVKSNADLVVHQPINFCPVPSWHVSGKCYSLESPTRLNGKIELFGYSLPSTDQIFSESTAVQHFFESAFQKADKVGTNFWANVKSGSLVHMEAEHILGSNWRKILDGCASEPHQSSLHSL